MPKLTGRFETRREAEMAVERLVQEHGIERSAIDVQPEGPENSAGDEAAGSDRPAGRPTSPARSDAALQGAIVVSVDVPEDVAATVGEALGA
mgnify:CR=1 FL=1